MNILDMKRKLLPLSGYMGGGGDSGGGAQTTTSYNTNIPEYARPYVETMLASAQQELFDYKPQLQELFNKDLPDSVRGGQRLTGMTSGQARFPVAPSALRFRQQGDAGIWMSETLPHIGRIADRLCNTASKCDCF